MSQVGLLRNYRHDHLAILCRYTFHRIQLAGTATGQENSFNMDRVSPHDFGNDFHHDCHDVHLLHVDRDLVMLLLASMLDARRFLVAVRHRLHSVNYDLNFHRVAFHAIMYHLVNHEVGLVRESAYFSITAFFRVALRSGPTGLEAGFYSPMNANTAQGLNYSLREFDFSYCCTGNKRLLTALLNLFIIASY